ncbi:MULTISPECIES: hypothetical protein [unclassified Fibrobacter]|jgi:hypothetical protein|nr:MULTISPECIES: hypothetical protein [unclassified Fibrobacter]
MRIEDLYRDATFTVNKNAPEEKFIKFYLQWDQDCERRIVLRAIVSGI